MPGREIHAGPERAWLDRWSLQLRDITPVVLEGALRAATTKRDGGVMAASVVQRRRNLVSSVFKAAVRRELIEVNPMDRMELRLPKRSMEVDVAVLPTVADVDEIVRHILALRSPGARFGVFFAVIGFAGLRPSEVAALRHRDLKLPAQGWGMATVRGAIASPGTRYTNDGESRQVKGLKHRPDHSTRLVPLPPPLVEFIGHHVGRWPGSGGLVFTNNGGRSVTAENYGRSGARPAQRCGRRATR